MNAARQLWLSLKRKLQRQAEQPEPQTSEQLALAEINKAVAEWNSRPAEQRVQFSPEEVE